MADADLRFADGLNCLIGGRGAGKTTALEFLRYGLGLMPDPKADLQRHRTIEGLVKANLGNGRITIELQTKTGMRYSAGRGAGETVQVLNEKGAAVPISLDRDQIFTADVFSQNEIEEIASNPMAQLDLLDRFQEEDSTRIGRDLMQLRRDADQSASDLRQLDLQIEDLDGKAAEGIVIEEKLKGLAPVSGPNASKLTAAHDARAARAVEARYPELVVTAAQKVTRDLNTIYDDFHAAVGTQIGKTTYLGANGALFKLLEKEANTFAEVLAASVKTVSDAARLVEERIRRHESSLASRHAVQEAEYRTLIEQHEEEGGRAAERLALQTSLVNAQAAAKEKEAKEKQRDVARAARKKLLTRASELRDERFGLRKRVAERLTGQFPTLRITVTQAADLSAYRALLADSMKGIGIKQGVTAERLSEIFLPNELAKLVAERDHQTLMRKAVFEEDRARKVIEALRANGASYDLELADLEDRPCIELRDGDTFKESTHLSTGQRCTTILPILLVQSERPLLVDQPEDNLDNAFVYDTIVAALKDVKGSRQVIFVTHNPNIPVLGEAERVFVFNSDGEHAEIRRVGTVDECKEDIERILEGGREAFLLRKKRYGH
jgi:AAA domain